jgi:hypothetical protein
MKIRARYASSAPGSLRKAFLRELRKTGKAPA